MKAIINSVYTKPGELDDKIRSVNIASRDSIGNIYDISLLSSSSSELPLSRKDIDNILNGHMTLEVELNFKLIRKESKTISVK